jgi:hypothetical protein
MSSPVNGQSNQLETVLEAGASIHDNTYTLGNMGKGW